MTSSTGLSAGDIIVDSSVRVTYKVIRLVGQDFVELKNVGVGFENSQIVAKDKIERKLAAGIVKRI